MTPVSPPITKVKMKPSTKSSGVAKIGRPPQIVAIQQKIWMPLGMAIIIEEAVKKLSPSCGRPVANIWCTHRPKERNPIAISDSTIPR